MWFVECGLCLVALLQMMSLFNYSLRCLKSSSLVITEAVDAYCPCPSEKTITLTWMVQLIFHQIFCGQSVLSNTVIDLIKIFSHFDSN